MITLLLIIFFGAAIMFGGLTAIFGTVASADGLSEKTKGIIIVIIIIILTFWWMSI